MSTTESTPSQPPTAEPPRAPVRRSRRRWWLVALALVGGGALVVLGVMGYFVLATQNAWNAAEAEADAIDPRWRLAELEADRPEIPDAENAAFLIIAAHAKGKGVYVSGAANYEEIFDKLPPNAQLNIQQAGLIRMQLNKIPAALKEARQLKDMPRGRFAVKFSDEWISTLIPNHQNARSIGEWLQHDAFLLAQDEHIDDALDSCVAILNAGRTAGDERFLIPHLIRLALQNMAMQTIERVLAQGQASEEKLEALQKAIERDIADTKWSGSLKSERAGAHHLFENLRSGKVKTVALRGMILGGQPRNPREWLMEAFPSMMLKYYPEYLHYMNRVVEISKLPLNEQKEKLAEIRITRDNTTNPVMLLLAPALEKVFEAERRNQALLRSTQVALACERYRIKHDNRWPKSLDELVAEKLLAAAPLDPIDGQPLRYRRDAEVLVIYSIGIDEKDDKGNIDRAVGNVAGIDVGFRLWSEPHRRDAPRPPIAILEKAQ